MLSRFPWEDSFGASHLSDEIELIIGFQYEMETDLSDGGSIVPSIFQNADDVKLLVFGFVREITGSGAS
jgi:hypothetical protein